MQAELSTLLNYRVLAGADGLGLLTGLSVDDHSWKLQRLEVDVSRWRPDGRAWVGAECIQQLSAARKQLALNISRDAVLDSPPPDGAARSVPDDAFSLDFPYGRAGAVDPNCNLRLRGL